jgi:hypothetical protein
MRMSPRTLRAFYRSTHSSIVAVFGPDLLRNALRFGLHRRLRSNNQGLSVENNSEAGAVLDTWPCISPMCTQSEWTWFVPKDPQASLP